MDPVEQFAQEAASFRDWVHSCGGSPHQTALDALIRLTRLYLAALGLPPEWSDELELESDTERVEDPLQELAGGLFGCLPIDLYGEVFNPLLVPPEEPVVGSLTDDICDIYRDVVTGLNAYEAGRRAAAIWEWSFGFSNHWGDHATGAIRALHAYLAEYGLHPDAWSTVRALVPGGRPSSTGVLTALRTIAVHQPPPWQAPTRWRGCSPT